MAQVHPSPRPQDGETPVPSGLKLVSAFPTAGSAPGDGPLPMSSRLMVLMFTDLVNSTGLKAAIGAGPYGELVARQDRILRRVLADVPRGRVVQDMGDGYFLAFDTVGEAVEAALRFQFRMRREAWPHPVEARVGLHLGQVAQLENESTGQPKVFASSVDIAARVVSLASGGQVLLTRVVFDEARQFVPEHPLVDGERPAIRWVAHGPYLFKGAEEPVEIFEVGGEGVAPLAPPADGEKAKRHIRPGEEQTLGWRPGVGLPMPSAPHWVLREKLGEGGFGEVWLAAHGKTGVARVFKFCFDAERLRALKREVVLFRLIKQALGDRRDIGRVIDWQFDAPPYFIEMDYAPHGNLARWAEGRGGIGAAPLAERLAIVAGVARALSAAHSVGVLHKDIKPSNVLMVRDAADHDYPRLTDFGIGVLTDRSRLAAFNITAAGFTASNVAVYENGGSGTRMYLPPESMTDKPHTVQGDVYALGVMLYQMVVGDLGRPIAAGWERHVEDPLLREDVAACVDGDPATRLKSAEELAERLETLDERRRAVAARAEAVERAAAARRAAADAARVSERRRRLVTALGGGALFFAVVAVGFGVLLVRLKEINFTLAGERQKLKDEQIRLSETNATLAGERQKLKDEQTRRRRELAQDDARHGIDLRTVGDAALALPYLVRALNHEPGDPAVEPDVAAAVAAHRARIAATVAQCPTPLVLGGASTGTLAGGEMPVSPLPMTVARDGRSVRRKDAGVEVVDPLGKQLFRNVRAEASKAAGHVEEVSLDAAGGRVAAAYADGVVVVWDARVAGKRLLEVRHGTGPATGAMFDQGGGRLVTVGGGAAKVWDLSAQPPLARELSAPVQRAWFDAGRARLATVGADGALSVWSFPNVERQIGKAVPVKGVLSSVVVSPFGPQLVAVCEDKVARVCDYEKGTVLAEVRHDEAIHAAAFGREKDAKRVWVATASKDRTVKFWTEKPPEKPLLADLTIKLPDEATGVAFNPADGSFVATTCKDGTARLWQFAHVDPELRWVTPNVHHRGAVRAVAFAAAGDVMVTATADLGLTAWALPPERYPYPDVAFGGAEKVESVVMEGGAAAGAVARMLDVSVGRVVVRNAATGAVLGTIDAPAGHRVKAAAFARGAGAGLVVTAGEEGQVLAWDPATPKQPVWTKKAAGSVKLVAADPAGKLLATATTDAVVQRWDAASGQEVGAATTRPAEKVNVFAFAPDLGTYLAVVDELTARVHLTEGGAVVAGGMAHRGKITTAEFSADGRRVVTAAEDHNARVWDAATGTAVGPGMLKHANKVLHASFSPDGKRVVTAGMDKVAYVWDVESGARLFAMEHDGEVCRAVFSPNGAFVATSMDNMYSARVWDARNGQPLSQWMAHPHPMRSVDRVWFTPDSRRLVTHAKSPGRSERRVFRLPETDWPAPDLEKLARLLSGREVPGATRTSRLGPKEYDGLLRELSGRYKEAFAPPGAAGGANVARGR